MLILVVADNKSHREASILKALPSLDEYERIVVSEGEIEELEQYLYPSLFSAVAPVIHARFLIDSDVSALDAARIKKFAASPTIFIFEEFALPSPVITLAKKHGAIVHATPKEKSTKPPMNIFAVAEAITASDKKSRWFAFRKAMETQPIEGVIGILYWKVRELALKDPQKDQYKKLYQALIEAHASAWKSGAPLELLIEKVILTQ
jgi:hypothetical protein